MICNNTTFKILEQDCCRIAFAFMFARGAHVGAVCLRCRLQLLRQVTPIRYVTSDASNTSHADDPASDQIDSEDAFSTFLEMGKDKSPKPRSRSRSRSGSGSRKLDLRKRHISGNRVLQEAMTSLGTDVLGKPAYAIVMKDGGKLRKKQIPLAPGENEPGTESLDNLAVNIEALLDSQRQPPSQREVMSNIDDLQPKTEKVLSEKGFRKLQNLLTDGFLNNQLQYYIRWRRPQPQPKPTDTSSSPEPEFLWIEGRSPWTPVQTQPNAVEGTGFAVQDYISDTTTPKERLAIRLMRECWGLSIAELQTQQGEIHIKVRSQEFILLMRGTQRYINTLSKVWLDPGEKIEAFRDQETLLLVTTKSKAESILRDLDETLRNLTTKTFPVLLTGTAEAPSDAVLEELGRMTNTHIRKSDELKKKLHIKQLHVTWIQVQSRAIRGLTHLEDMAHIVFRLLLTASGPPQTTSSLLSTMAPHKHAGRFVVDAAGKDKLAWRDKLSRWARFVYPLAPGKQDVVNPTLPIEEFELPFEPTRRTETLNGSHTLVPEIKSPPLPVMWSNTLHTSTVACFGQILHPYQSADPKSLSDVLASPNRRVFSPTTPHPLHLSRFETNNSDSGPQLVTTKSTIVLRFWPSPGSKPHTMDGSADAFPEAGDMPPAPVLELRLAATNREVKGVESLRAIKRTHHTDVMLPSSLVDVRFTQTQYETLRPRDADGGNLAEWPPLAHFLENARLDVENGKLEMPPHQRFPVPRRLSAKEFESADSADQERDQPPTSDEDELVSVSYEFVGLEFHRSATLPYDGHQLTYTSIEGGQGGGRRAEVTLEPIESLEPTPKTETADARMLQENFLGSCSRFAANRSLWSGIGNPKRWAQ
ncbi:hypothetical protein F4803DRAFT_482822 [Xylaria telfairii]|nr:hypothetical protein F4803DRAFT_482822 [Xylaria telfairii]